ncbi:hypothetical protein, partial [Micromonospora sp. NPDC049799]|uniref:hypothetical protein n=1 Tax=Micromonospora sp. NPDC049799 TaxID=3154741 RepID=UPI0033F073D5
MIRVAMLHGPGRPDADGVSDYVTHLVDALGEVDVEVTPVPLRPTRARGGWRSAVNYAPIAVGGVLLGVGLWWWLS